MRKFFIITVDTESDNQWDCHQKQTTENAKYIPRFQDLCNQFGFKPVYLVDYSMANDSFLVSYLKKCIERNLCEVGMHLHAWDTPPINDIDMQSETRPYLIEYSNEMIEKKIMTLHNLLCDSFETQMFSHRAGRWAINSFYIQLLESLKYKVDCSVTPNINWQSAKGAFNGGCDYRGWKDIPTYLTQKKEIIEVPVSVCNKRFISLSNSCFYKEFAKCILGRKLWLRPALFSNEQMMRVVHHFEKRTDYIEFMLHSSELMPAGSPYFVNSEAIENLYVRLKDFFCNLNEMGYEGVSLKEYYDIFRGKNDFI